VKRLRVAIVTQFPLDPDAPSGGVEAVSVNLVRHLAQEPDLDVQVLTLADVSAAATRAWQGASLHFLPRPSGSMLLLAMNRGRKIILDWLSSNPADVVHAHDTYGLMIKGYPGKRVFTVHGFIHGDTLVSGSPFAGVRAAVWKRVETAGWADQPNIISISPYVRERVSAFSTARIRDIDNPVAAGFFDMPWQPVANTIFSAAVISPRKNTLRLIEACHVLRRRGIDAQLRLAGPVVDARYGELIHRYIDEHQLHHCVHLLGSLSSSRVREELGRSSVFALVSLEENSPMGIEEAMAVGIPVVSSNRCGMPYMIRHGASGFLVDPHDAEDIASAVARIWADDATLHAMGAVGKQMARERFHPAVVAAQTIAFYQELI
jgi:glycosyltransferase involved in cell wall biosynthesis